MGHILTTKIGRRLKSASTGQVDLATGLNFKISHMTKFIPPLCRTSQGDKKIIFYLYKLDFKCKRYEIWRNTDFEPNRSGRLDPLVGPVEVV
jgi:hypothetical protein